MNLKKVIITCAVTVGALFSSAGAASAYDRNSVVDYLAAQGKDASFENRTKLAGSIGISAYRGSEKQNITLLSKLRGESSAVSYKTAKKSSPVVESKPVAERKPSANGRSLQVVATAYTAYCYGCSGITATGVDLRSNPNQKVIAVDPNVIPLGSTVYVEGYGQAIAADTGGAIKGNRIDIFMPSQADALQFGRKTVNVTVQN
ncbi:L-alanyl-D-glutamate peptidase [Bacillus phage Bobb]|uniref:Cell wall-binding, peptidase-related domain protein n=1 Tax=Bacillus phage Bobb TaxID=1527469 RepID=A0A076G914_9CAUD|nr:L-alanyl-D-glutamate peptidase [Bacillus phage Bobb]AII28083.1 cell wall-binding, peptidase-related domain protein [Bacillus phage Bobb]